jgi:HK97 family phage major capsid protein
MYALDLAREARANLEQNRSEALDRMEAIAQRAIDAGRPMTTDEARDCDELRRNVEHLDEQLAAIDTREAELLEVAERTAARAARPSLRTLTGSQPWDAFDQRRPNELSLADWRSLALSAVERSADRLGDGPAAQLTESIEAGEDRHGVAKVVAVGSDPDYRSAWLKVMRDGHLGHVELTPAERAAWARAQDITRAMGEGSTAAGAAMVPTHLDPAVILTNSGIADPMRSIARTVNITTKTWNGVSSAGVTASWDAEAEEVSDDSPTLAQPSIDVHAARVFVPFSWELSQDVDGLESELATLAADAYARLEGEAFWTGSGSGEPTGIVTTLDATTSSEVQLIDTTSYVLSIDDLYALHKALPARYRRGGATWAANIDLLDRCRRFGEGTTGSNSAYWADLGADTPPHLLGHPVVEASSMPTYTATNGTNLVVIGDFSRYVIVDRIGTIVQSIPTLFGTTNGRPTFEGGLAFFRRTGGEVVDTGAFRLLQC